MKKLVISVCNDCPFFRTNQIHGIDDSYQASCYNPVLEQPFEWVQKRGRDAIIPKLCPLPNSESED